MKISYLCHHEIPGQGDSIPLTFGSVIFSYRMFEKIPGMVFSLISINTSQNNGSDLEQCDYNNEETISCQKDTRFFNGATISKKTKIEIKYKYNLIKSNLIKSMKYFNSNIFWLQQSLFLQNSFIIYEISWFPKKQNLIPNMKQY